VWERDRSVDGADFKSDAIDGVKWSGAEMQLQVVRAAIE